MSEIGEIEAVPVREWRHVPAEGEGGVYTQSWFPICLSEELSVGQILSRPFLGGKVVVYRGQDGRARVFSAYCVHVGADLAVGEVRENGLLCRFHRWEYSSDGSVFRTGHGDRPHPRACLFKFPTVERWGLIWVFNGTKPLWTLPDLKYPDADLVGSSQYCYSFDGDPWWFAANTLDFSHFEQLHGLDLGRYPDEEIEWTPYHVKYEVNLTHWGNTPISFQYGTYGSNIFISQGYYEGRWYAEVGPRSLPKPGRSDLYITILTQRAAGESDAEQRAFHQKIVAMELKFAEQDKAILQTIQFKAGYLTRRDKALGKFLDYIRAFPRAHPSADFIR